MIKVIFFATPQIAIKSLDYLVKSGKINVMAVVTQPDRPVGRGHKITPPPVKQYATEHGIKVFQTESIKKDFELQAEIKNLEPDFFLTFAFGQILSKDVLDIPKYSTINLHASLLPLYRGANPIQRALINGDKKTGICTMITEVGLDCGAVCLRDEIEISEDMNYEELFDLIAQKSPELIETTLLSIKSGAMKPQAQCCDNVTYAHKITKEEAKINWDKTAREIHNLVRGIYKSPGAYCIFKDKTIKIMQTKVVSDETLKGKIAGEIIKIDKEGIEIYAGTGILRFVKIKPEGKGEMFAKDWANGAKLTIGEIFL